jgi:hypothetical protein
MEFADLLQASLFGAWEQAVGELSDKAKLLIAVLVSVPPQAHLPAGGGWRGRPAKHRQALATAFLAKAVYGLETTRQLIDRLCCDRQLLRLCGWDSARQLPSESTFSRAFEEFAHTQLPQRWHEAVIQKTQRDRLIGHIARDSTAIEARERYPDHPQPLPKKKRYKKSPKAKRNTPRSPRNHIEEQRLMSLPELLAELPGSCSLGVKKSSKGHLSYWRGYKLHLDVADGDIPISALLTSANLHDSQVAVPLMQLTSWRSVIGPSSILCSAIALCAPKCHCARTRVPGRWLLPWSRSIANSHLRKAFAFASALRWSVSMHGSKITLEDASFTIAERRKSWLI